MICLNLEELFCSPWTYSELILERANSQKEHMDLTTWQDSPDGKIKKSDVTVAKNVCQARCLADR